MMELINYEAFFKGVLDKKIVLTSEASANVCASWKCDDQEFFAFGRRKEN